MKTFIMNDKLIIAEILSVISYSIFIFNLAVNQLIKLNEQDSVFWVILFSIFALIQLISIIFSKDMQFLRLCMTWVSGSIWTWLAYANKEFVLLIPMVLIGLLNFASFINLCNKTSIDWHTLIKD